MVFATYLKALDVSGMGVPISMSQMLGQGLPLHPSLQAIMNLRL